MAHFATAGMVGWGDSAVVDIVPMWEYDEDVGGGVSERAGGGGVSVLGGGVIGTDGS